MLTASESAMIRPSAPASKTAHKSQSNSDQQNPARRRSMNRNCRCPPPLSRFAQLSGRQLRRWVPANAPNRIAGSTSRSTIARFRAVVGCRWPSAGCGRRKRRLRDHGFLFGGWCALAAELLHTRTDRRKVVGSARSGHVSSLKASSSFDAARVVYGLLGR